MIQLKAASLSLAVAVLTIGQSGHAQTNLVPVTFSAVCTTSNATGLVQERVSNINLIDDCASEHGLTNLSNLSLVFNVTNFSLQVVDTNGVAVCTSLAFTGGLTFTNTTGSTNATNGLTQIIFQRDVLVETNSTSSGVLSGIAVWNTTNPASFRLTGNLLYTEPASGTNGPEICRATLRVGNEEQGEQNEGKPGRGHEGNEGNHFGWQNQNNPHSRH